MWNDIFCLEDTEASIQNRVMKSDLFHIRNRMFYYNKRLFYHCSTERLLHVQNSNEVRPVGKAREGFSILFISATKI